MFAYKAAAAWCCIAASIALSLQTLAVKPMHRHNRTSRGQECQTCEDSGACPPDYKDMLAYTELQYEGYPHRRYTTRDGQGTPGGGNLFLWRWRHDPVPWLRYQVLYRNQAYLRMANNEMARERGFEWVPQFHPGAPSSRDSRHVDFDAASRNEPNEDAIVLRFRPPRKVRDLYFFIRSGHQCHISTSTLVTGLYASQFEQAVVAYSEFVLPRIFALDADGDAVSINATIGPR